MNWGFLAFKSGFLVTQIIVIVRWGLSLGTYFILLSFVNVVDVVDYEVDLKFKF